MARYQEGKWTCPAGPKGLAPQLERVVVFGCLTDGFGKPGQLHRGGHSSPGFGDSGCQKRLDQAPIITFGNEVGDSGARQAEVWRILVYEGRVSPQLAAGRAAGERLLRPGERRLPAL